MLVVYICYQNSSLVTENGNLKATNGALVKEVSDLKGKYNQTSALVGDLKTTNGALVKEMDDLKEKYNQTSALVGDLKATKDALVKEVSDLKAANGTRVQVKSMMKRLMKGFEGSTTTRFGGISNYLNTDGKRKAGESFTLKGLSWHLLFEPPIFGSYLEVHLCLDTTDFFGYTFSHWSANATFDLTLVNHEEKKKSITENFSSDDMFEKNSKYHCYGTSRFVRIADLYGGFVKHDALEFEVQIKSVEFDLFD